MAEKNWQFKIEGVMDYFSLYVSDNHTIGREFVASHCLGFHMKGLKREFEEGVFRVLLKDLATQNLTAFTIEQIAWKSGNARDPMVTMSKQVIKTEELPSEYS